MVQGSQRRGCSVIDEDLHRLADRAGVSTWYRDAFGHDNAVSPDTLRAVLRAIGLPGDSQAQIADSLAILQAREDGRHLPPLITADAGQSISLGQQEGAWELTLENGTRRSGTLNPGESLPPIEEPGYHSLEIAGQRITIANAPAECKRPRHGSWGVAAQLYALRREGDGGIGDFAALARFAPAAARQGAQAIGISPVHAQFSADPDRFSPYSPSSRIALNVLHGDDSGLLDGFSFSEGEAERQHLESLSLIDWPAATRLRLRRYRALFDALGGTHPDFTAWRAGPGKVVEDHARFEALHGHFFGTDPSRWNWRSWPDEYRHPASVTVQRFAAEHAKEVDFHAFLQFLAERGLAHAQRAARESGMEIGLITDLAVGTDGGGSHCWSRQKETLIGLSVGAPPDLLSPQGQDWGLTAFSPVGLMEQGFSAFIEMLRAALRHAGGVRIDHVMGIARLWVLPEGARATEGAYLRFPLQDMLRLTALESHAHQALILGEDLGTVPEGFSDALQARAVHGLRVLYFERGEHDFKPPEYYSRTAVAMTSTHDLAPVAGWWSGHDLETRKSLRLLSDDTAIWLSYEERERDRQALWGAMQASGAAQGDAPEAHNTGPAVDAAIRHIGRTHSTLVLLPMEDALGLREQPNLPGTYREHPNWRRRFNGAAEALFDSPDVSHRLQELEKSRPS
ncbi:4-alpha-glucanotransferase [Granulibacter bethesdensis]|nr:4-alpha-glucanotransferase [Granulibacter bethesdensis]